MSRKSKRDWRKNIDISQEEELLAQERTAAIDGVFFEDKKTTKQKLSKQEAREWKTVRERLLLPKSHVRAVGIGPSTPKRISGEAAHVNKLVEKLKKSKGTPSSASSTAHPQKKPYDLWTEGPRNVGPRTKQLALAPPPVPSGPAATLQRPLAPAVELAPPGASYRPAPEDLQQLKRRSREEDRAKTAQQKKLDRQLSYPKYLDRVSKRMKTDEEFALPSDSEHETEVNQDVGLAAEDDEAKELAKHYSMKLTDKDRRRLRREHRAAARHRKQKQPSESFEKQLKEAVKEANKRAKAQRRREQTVQTTEKRPKLGSKEFVETPTAAILQQPSSAMRVQTQKLNPVKDRFLSIQRRGLVEKRDATTKRRRYALRTIVKRSALTPAI